MFTRRIATFIIGAWLGCAVLMCAVALVSGDSGSETVLVLPEQAQSLSDKIGQGATETLLNFQASEQLRRHWYSWEDAQMFLALALAVSLGLSGRGKLFPLVLTALMFGVLMFQHFGIMPTLQRVGRDLAFLTENRTPVEQELWSQLRIYGGLETLKLLLGGVLASYLFVAQNSRRSRRSSRKRHSDFDDLDVEMQARHSRRAG